MDEDEKLAALKKRVRERIKKIKDTKDDGYYAKQYFEDCSELLIALEMSS